MAFKDKVFELLESRFTTRTTMPDIDCWKKLISISIKNHLGPHNKYKT